MKATLELSTAAFHIVDRHPGARAVLEFAYERHRGGQDLEGS
jgi:hypothetical protein